MLKVLRKRKRSWVIFTVLGAIILVFIFWGIGSFRVDKGAIAARVNGKPITATEYVKAYQQQINYYRNKLKDQFSDELLDQLNLKQNTIQMLVNTTLELQEAKRQGITVSTEEVQKTIASVPMFQRGGVFNKEQYIQVLNANRILPGEYEKSVNESLIIEKLHKKITDTIHITDKELEDTFVSENRKVNLQYLAMDGTRLEKDMVATDEEARAYFEKNKAALKAPTYEGAAGSIKSILVKQKAREKAREDADALLKKLQQGEDIQKLASKQGYIGGETGFVTKAEGFIKNIGLYAGDKPALFLLGKENPYYNQVVPHREKFFIFKLKDSKDADKAEFEAKRAEIKNRLLQEREEEALSKWLNELRSKAKIEINEEAL